jgi:class 3 adenylate cyclase
VAVDDDDRLALVHYLLGLGATEEELAEAEQSHSLSELAVDLVLRPPGPVLDFAAAAEQAGMGIDDAARVWRAFGFADPLAARPQVAPDMAAALSLIALAWRDLIGPDAALAVARVTGASISRLAQAIVDAFRVQFELPQLQAGTPRSEVVRGYTAVAEELVPRVVETMGALLRAHIVAAAAAAWSHDEERSTTTRTKVVVGFADLVGYTALSRTLSPRQLAGLVDGFENAVNEAASRGGGRVVKLMGDGAMFVCEDPAGSVALAVDLCRRVAASGDLPPVRVALAQGDVVAMHGDYFGEVVNLSARLLAVAAPSTVVVAESMAAVAATAGYSVEQLPASSLKGIPDPSVAFRVLA